MKFLHSPSTEGVLHFQWPESDHIEIVHTNRIFWGPIFLEGCNPFTIQNVADIEATFKAKKHLGKDM